MSQAQFYNESFRYREWYQGCGGKVDALHGSVELTLSGLEATKQWVAEPKRDGIWCAAFMGKDSNEFYSRTQERKPYSLDTEVVPCLEGCLLIGELGFGSQESLRRRKELGFDFMDVFDILFHKYVWVGDLNGEDRRELLERTLLKAPREFILSPRWTTGFAQQYTMQPEGLILKPAQGYKYVGSGTKVKYWLKAKKDHTVDMVIMGWKKSEAETKTNEAHVEYIACGMYVAGELKELVHVGSMTRELSHDIAVNYGQYHNRVIELKHFGQFRSGALRHPSVVRLRDDKHAEQCVFDPESLSAGSFGSI